MRQCAGCDTDRGRGRVAVVSSLETVEKSRSRTAFLAVQGRNLGQYRVETPV
ncbi:MAG: hypothetical protein ACI9W2_003690 [Gammaproteobacteria bacterium]|jgi:hypothetical protein